MLKRLFLLREIDLHYYFAVTTDICIRKNVRLVYFKPQGCLKIFATDLVKRVILSKMYSEDGLNSF